MRQRVSEVQDNNVITLLKNKKSEMTHRHTHTKEYIDNWRTIIVR